MQCVSHQQECTNKSNVFPSNEPTANEPTSPPFPELLCLSSIRTFPTCAVRAHSILGAMKKDDDFPRWVRRKPSGILRRVSDSTVVCDDNGQIKLPSLWRGGSQLLGCQEEVLQAIMRHRCARGMRCCCSFESACMGHEETSN